MGRFILRGKSTISTINIRSSTCIDNKKKTFENINKQLNVCCRDRRSDSKSCFILKFDFQQAALGQPCETTLYCNIRGGKIVYFVSENTHIIYIWLSFMINRRNILNYKQYIALKIWPIGRVYKRVCFSLYCVAAIINFILVNLCSY